MSSKEQVISTISSVIRLYWDLVSLNEDEGEADAMKVAEKLLENNRRRSRRAPGPHRGQAGAGRSGEIQARGDEFGKPRGAAGAGSQESADAQRSQQPSIRDARICPWTGSRFRPTMKSNRCRIWSPRRSVTGPTWRGPTTDREFQNQFESLKKRAATRPGPYWNGAEQRSRRPVEKLGLIAVSRPLLSGRNRKSAVAAFQAQLPNYTVRRAIEHPLDKPCGPGRRCARPVGSAPVASAAAKPGAAGAAGNRERADCAHPVALRLRSGSDPATATGGPGRGTGAVCRRSLNKFLHNPVRARPDPGPNH